jgi:hypothetical protein
LECTITELEDEARSRNNFARVHEVQPSRHPPGRVLGGFADPAHLLIGAALPENVDTVVIDGRILKRDGKLTALLGSQVAADARASLEAIRKRANWRRGWLVIVYADDACESAYRVKAVP